jgi:hypothetical protein
MCESFNLVLMKKCVNIIKKTIHKKWNPSR